MKFKRKSASKQMTAYFILKFGYVTTIPLEDRKTVTADWYVNHCLPIYSRQGVNGVPKRVSVVFCSIMTMPARTQQL